MKKSLFCDRLKFLKDFSSEKMEIHFELLLVNI